MTPLAVLDPQGGVAESTSVHSNDLNRKGVSGLATYLVPSTEPASAMATSVTVEKSRPVRKLRIRKAVLVEDGHSLAEQAVYDVLWTSAVPLAEPVNKDRTIRIGYRSLAEKTRLSWVSVKTNLRSLEKKLAIQVTDSENSAAREGKCYRVYSRSAILERRRQAGLEWVCRSRGVELLKKATWDEDGSRG
jgi:hypothetical protein